MRRIVGVFAMLALLGVANAQQWQQVYADGLKAAQGGKWSEARTAFKQAIAFRPEDTANPTVMPGPINERRTWRDGAAYSPNFLAAYSGFKASGALTGADRTAMLNEVANEFEAVLKKSQHSPEAYFFLNNTYVQLGDNDRREKLEQRLSALGNKVNFKVDREGVTPEDQTAVNTAFQRTGPVVSPPIDNQGTVTNPPVNPNNPTLPTGNVGFGTRVGTIPTKFALLIGNGESQITDRALPFAADSAQMIRETLITSSGYMEENVDLVLNATSEQIMKSAAALAERMPRGATVMIFFAGQVVLTAQIGAYAGKEDHDRRANLSGKDYLAGVDSQSITESASMVPKSELYKVFVAKEANIFAFYEASRPIVKGRYFGAEVPMYGRVAQMQATMPGTDILSSVRQGKTVGLFTDAMASVFTEERSNQFPIMEFGWKVFYKIRGGEGGGGSQTPTLPVRVGLDDKAKF